MTELKSHVPEGVLCNDNQAKTVLVAEDDRTHRTLVEKILAECGFDVQLAENGYVVLSKLDFGMMPGLILMDWDMPEMDGLETVKAIRARQVEKNLPHIPVIAFTSYTSDEDREACLAAGMDGYLPKDIWMPKWRQTLIDNLQGLISGVFDIQDLDLQFAKNPPSNDSEYDLNAFDIQAVERTASLLKDEIHIAVDEYLEDAAAYIQDIQKGMDENDAEKVARASHPLKSNSLGFGLTAVSELAAKINKSAEEGNLDSIRELPDLLKQTFHRAEKKLKETIKNAGY